jgi:hypothetical protein
MDGEDGGTGNKFQGEVRESTMAAAHVAVIIRIGPVHLLDPGRASDKRHNLPLRGLLF